MFEILRFFAAALDFLTSLLTAGICSKMTKTTGREGKGRDGTGQGPTEQEEGNLLVPPPSRVVNL